MIKNKRFVPAKVSNIVASSENSQPIRFVLTLPTGEQGYLDVALSQTNLNLSFYLYNTFESYFFEKDPHTLYSFPAEIWSAIDNRKVIVGMSKEQAGLVWGYPKTTKETETAEGKSTFWSYANGRHLLFSNGKVAVISED